MNTAQKVNAASAILMLVCGSYLSWVVLPAVPAGFAWDDTWYLLMAEWFSGRDEHVGLAYEMMKLRQYPPFFPYLIALTGGGLGGYSFVLILNVFMLALSGVLHLRWLVDEGVHWLVALFAALPVMLNPVALEFSSVLSSEPLFLFLSTLALLLISKSNDSIKRWGMIGLLIGLAIATRSAGWALALAFLGHVLLFRRFSSALALAAGLLLGLLFMLYLKAGLPQAHTYTQGFLENLTRVNVEYLIEQIRSLFAGWQRIWGGLTGAVLTMAIIIPGLAWRLRQKRADALYVVIYLLMLIAWPFPDQMGRFLWALLPALLASAGTSLSLVSKPGVRLPVGAVLLLAFALTVPAGIGRVTGQLLAAPEGPLYDLSRMSDWSMAPDRETGLMHLRVSQLLLEDMRHISAATNQSDCVFTEYPALTSLHALRVSTASPWNHPDDMGAFRLNCEYYYLVPDALPAVSNDDVNELATRYDEVFRSLAPYDTEGKRVLGLFLKLK